MVFNKHPRSALDHYRLGVLIGELSLCEGFEGVLWRGMIDNRPFLRYLNGLGLCLWRLVETLKSRGFGVRRETGLGGMIWIVAQAV
jgi:hypothetical protein